MSQKERNHGASCRVSTSHALSPLLYIRAFCRNLPCSIPNSTLLTQKMDLPKHSTSGKSGKSKHYFPIHMSSQTVFTDTYKYNNHRNTEYIDEHIDVTDRELLERRPVPSLKVLRLLFGVYSWRQTPTSTVEVSRVQQKNVQPRRTRLQHWRERLRSARGLR